MNKSKTEVSTQEKVLGILAVSTDIDAFTSKVKKETDLRTLKELWLIVYQRSENELVKIVNARMKTLDTTNGG